MSLNTELELQSLLSRMLAVETSVEEVTAAVGIDATKSSSALVVRDTVPFEVTLETASGTGPKAVNRVRVLLGSVYIGTTFGGSQVLTQDPAIVSGDVASAVDPADAGFWLTTANATAATDVWVEVNHLTLYWRLRIRVRVSATVPEWRAAGNVAWGAEGVSVFPLFSTGWSSTLASFDPFTVYQHRFGDIIIPATQPVWSVWWMYISDVDRVKVTTPASGTVRTVVRIAADTPVEPTAGTAEYDTEYTIAADTYFYLKSVFDPASTPHDTVTFEKNTTGFPVNVNDVAAQDFQTFWPLWFVDWDSSLSRIGELVDCRQMPQLRQQS